MKNLLFIVALSLATVSVQNNTFATSRPSTPQGLKIGQRISAYRCDFDSNNSFVHGELVAIKHKGSIRIGKFLGKDKTGKEYLIKTSKNVKEEWLFLGPGRDRWEEVELGPKTISVSPRMVGKILSK